jgi:hypothetical protein
LVATRVAIGREECQRGKIASLSSPSYGAETQDNISGARSTTVAANAATAGR